MNILCNNQGKADVKAHCKSTGHLQKVTPLQKQPRLDVVASEATTDKVTKTEVKMAVLYAHSTLSITFHDKLSPALRNDFSDSKIASQYFASTKVMCMLNGAVTPFLISKLIIKMKNHAFSLMIDDSNDSGFEKMNRITVRVDNVNFLDKCPTTRATAEAIFMSMDRRVCKLLEIENPWFN